MLSVNATTKLIHYIQYTLVIEATAYILLSCTLFGRKSKGVLKETNNSSVM